MSECGVILLEKPITKGDCRIKCEDCPTENEFPPRESDCPYFQEGREGIAPGCDLGEPHLSLERRTLQDINLLGVLERSGKLPNILPIKN